MRAAVHYWLNTLVLRYGTVPLLGRLLWWAFAQWQRVMP